MRFNNRMHGLLYCSPSLLEEMARGYLISEGICLPFGIKTIETKEDGGKKVKMSTSDVLDAVRRLDEHSIFFKKTGGTHVAETYRGRSSVFAEDVSRHHVIDKVIGLASQMEMTLTASTMITSCRQTVSTITKAAYSQIPIVMTISAPTHLSIKTAERLGITLIGFARANGFNTYSHEWRITDK